MNKSSRVTSAELPDRDVHILKLLKSKESAEVGFNLLVQEYQEKLYWQIRKIVVSHEDADDLVQDVFIKIFRKMDQFQEQSSLYTWMYRIAQNETLNFLKKRGRQNHWLTGEQDISNHTEGNDFFDSDEAEIILRRAVSALPEKQRQVFVMRYYDEMKYEEIEEILGTSTGGLKSSYHHAVKKIENFIKNHVG